MCERKISSSRSPTAAASKKKSLLLRARCRSEFEVRFGCEFLSFFFFFERKEKKEKNRLFVLGFHSGKCSLFCVSRRVAKLSSLRGAFVGGSRDANDARKREKKLSPLVFGLFSFSLSLSLSLGEGAGGSFKRSFFARVETIPLFWKEREREISGTDDAGGE